MISAQQAFAGSFINFAQLDTKAAAFETANGETIVTYYSPVCKPDMKEHNFYYVNGRVCANFIFDLNGNKGPNTVGKDIGFMSVIYPTDSSVVMPVPYIQSKSGLNWYEAGKYCRAMDDGARLPNREELISMFVNKKLLNSSDEVFNKNVYSSQVVDWKPTHAYYLYLGNGVANIVNRESPDVGALVAYCVRRN